MSKYFPTSLTSRELLQGELPRIHLLGTSVNKPPGSNASLPPDIHQDGVGYRVLNLHNNSSYGSAPC